MIQNNEITTTVETITPESAKEYLQRNNINRNINQSRVNAYADEIKNGKWQLNGEAIRFNTSGSLIDGQHRLSAIIKAEIPVEMCVMRNIPDDVSIYDRGRPRDITDSMLISGMSKVLANNTNVAIGKLHYLAQSSKNGAIPDYWIENFLNKHKTVLLNLAQVWRKHHDKYNGKLSTKNVALLLACMYAVESGESFESILSFTEVYRTGFVQNSNQNAAIVCRNDAICGNINNNGSANRLRALFIYEKAISDFCKGYGRTKTYRAWDKPVYSNNAMFKENNTENKKP